MKVHSRGRTGQRFIEEDRMGKKKEKLPKEFEFPPEIFWIKPDGKVIPVIGHLTAIQQRPKFFGFMESPTSAGDADFSFGSLFGDGWVRGRFSLVDGVASFHMARPASAPVANARAFVLKYAAFIQKVEVDFYDPAFFKAARDFTKNEFAEGAFPEWWQLNPKRRR
jgi:hypothetical protein